MSGAKHVETGPGAIDSRPGQVRTPTTSRGTGRVCPVKLSIVIPAYNEDRRLVAHLTRLLSELKRVYASAFEVIIVDDGSRQPVECVLGELSREPAIRVIRHAENRGKGAALRSGLLAARGAIVVFADADGATPPPDLIRLARAIDRGVDLAIGCRVRGAAAGKVHRHWYRRFGGRLFATVARWFTGCPVVDPQIGFKALHRGRVLPVLQQVQERGYLFDLELLTLAWKAGLKIRAMPVAWSECPGSRLRFLRDGLRMVERLVWLGYRLPRRGRNYAESRSRRSDDGESPGSPAPQRLARSKHLFTARRWCYDGFLLHRWFFLPTYRVALQHVRWPDHGWVLDVGCGNSAFHRFLTLSTRQRLTYVGLDPVPRSEHGLLVRGEAERLPFRHDTFDVVVCFHAAHHFWSVGRGCHEMARVVRENGVVVVADGDINCSWGRILHSGIVRSIERDVRFLTHERWLRLFGKCGLQLEQSLVLAGAAPVRVWITRKNPRNRRNEQAKSTDGTPRTQEGERREPVAALGPRGEAK